MVKRKHWYKLNPKDICGFIEGIESTYSGDSFFYFGIFFSAVTKKYGTSEN